MVAEFGLDESRELPPSFRRVEDDFCLPREGIDAASKGGGCLQRRGRFCVCSGFGRRRWQIRRRWDEERMGG